MAPEGSHHESSTPRAIAANALAALLAAQTHWTVIKDLTGPEREVVEQWAAKAKVDLGRADARARAKLLDVANDELVTLALGSARPKAQDKLGDLGLVSPRRYRFEQTPQLRDLIGRRGVTKREIEDTVHSPDAYQHLFPPGDFNPDVELMSLFVRVLNRAQVAQDGALAVWCLVVAKREGLKIAGYDAFRVYEDIVKFADGSPLELLRAFCEVYGMELDIKGKRFGKFLTYAKILVEPNVGLGWNAERGRSFSGSTILRSTDDGFLEFALAYAIDSTAYESDLKARGVNLS